MSATQLVGPVALMSRSTKAGAGRVASPRVVVLAERWRPARSLPACCISRATRLCPTRRPRPAIRRGCAGDHTPRGSNSRSPRCAPAVHPTAVAATGYPPARAPKSPPDRPSTVPGSPPTPQPRGRTSAALPPAGQPPTGRQEVAKQPIHLSTMNESPPSRSPLVFRRPFG